MRPPEVVERVLKGGRTPFREVGKRVDAQGKVYPVYQVTSDVDMLLELARDARVGLEVALDQIAAETAGVIRPGQYPPRVKAVERLRQKLRDRPADGWVDYLAGRLWIERPQDMATVLEAIARTFPMVEAQNFLEQPRPGGYRAIHLAVELPNSLIAEIQLVPREIGEVQHIGHSLHEQWRTREATTLTPEEMAAYDSDRTATERIFVPRWVAWREKGMIPDP